VKLDKTWGERSHWGEQEAGRAARRRAAGVVFTLAPLGGESGRRVWAPGGVGQDRRGGRGRGGYKEASLRHPARTLD
jgi:hypothetical protein